MVFVGLEKKERKVCRKGKTQKQSATSRTSTEMPKHAEEKHGKS